MLYISQRRHIISTLTGWLKQRKFAFELVKQTPRAAKAAELVVLLEYYQNASLAAVCHIVSDYQDSLTFLAPGEQSKHYPRYAKVIVPIIQYCIKANGGAQ